MSAPKCAGLLILVGTAAIAAAGCAQTRNWSFWPFGPTSDTVPGIVTPAEQKERIRAMAKQGAAAGAAEQEQLCAELAARFQAESDPLLRTEIVRAAASCRSESAATVLRAGIADADADVRIAACRAWGRRRSPDAAAALSQVLASDTDLDVRLAAARALGDTGDRAAVAALGQALEDTDPAMQYCAVESLRQVTGRNLGNDVDEWRQYVASSSAAETPPSVAQRVREWFY